MRISLYQLAQLAHNCMVDARTKPELFVDSSENPDDAIVLQKDDQDDDSINIHRHISSLQQEVIELKLLVKGMLKEIRKTPK
jgi:hypothetical protein